MNKKEDFCVAHTLFRRGDGITDDSEISLRNCSHNETVRSFPSKEESTEGKEVDSADDPTDDSTGTTNLDSGKEIDIGWLLPI